MSNTHEASRNSEVHFRKLDYYSHCDTGPASDRTATTTRIGVGYGRETVSGFAAQTFTNRRRRAIDVRAHPVARALPLRCVADRGRNPSLPLRRCARRNLDGGRVDVQAGESERSKDAHPWRC